MLRDADVLIYHAPGLLALIGLTVTVSGVCLIMRPEKRHQT